MNKTPVACPGTASAPVGTPPVEKRSVRQRRRRENNPRRPCLPSIGAARRENESITSVALASQSLSEQADIPHQAIEHFADVGDEHRSNQR